MEIKYNENLNHYTFKELEVGDTFVFENGEVFVKTKFFTVCSREGISPSKCVPLNYNAYNLSLNEFAHFDTETGIRKVNCTLEVN